MSHAIDAPVWAGLERRLAEVEAWIREPVPWRPAGEEPPIGSIRLVRGPAFGRSGSGGRHTGLRPVALLVALALAALVGLLVVGVASHPTPRTTLVPGFNTLGVITHSRIRGIAVALPDGRALVIGVDPESSGSASDLAEVYDPATATFTPTGPLPPSFRPTPSDGTVFTATGLGDGRVLVTNGHNAAAAIFDPMTATFTLTGSLSTPRSYPSTAVLGSGQVLVVGGEADTGPAAPIFSSAEVFDPTTGRFTPTGSLAVALSAATATTLADGRVLVTAGEGQAGLAELYDPHTRAFAPTGTMTTLRRQHAVSMLSDGRVLVLGGLLTPSPGPDDELLGSAEVFDPATGSFTAVGSLVVPRRMANATLLNDGRVLVTGGYDLAGIDTHLPSELFDPSTMRFSPVAGSLIAPESAVARLADGNVLFVGGNGAVDLFHP